MTEKVTLLRTATAGLNEELRKMGPEGELVGLYNHFICTFISVTKD